SSTSQALAAAGARDDVISRFDGTTDANGGAYALISGLHSGGTPNTQVEEMSAERTTTSGSMSALLVRGGTDLWNDYIPFVSDGAAPDPLASNRYRVMPMLYAPQTTWANWVRVNQTGPLRAPTAGETAALNYIVGYATDPNQNWVDISTPCPNAPDPIRGYYCDTNASDLGTLHDEIAGMSYNAADGQTNGYT